MKAYIVRNSQNASLIGRLFYQVNGQTILLATPTLPQIFWENFLFKKLVEGKLVEEVNLLDMKWAHPHLFKPVKAELQKILSNTAE